MGESNDVALRVILEAFDKTKTGVDSAESNLGRVKAASLGAANGLNAISGATIGYTLGLGTLVLAGKSALEISEKREQAERSLAQAIEVSGANQDYAHKQLTDFMQSNRAFITDQAEAVEAYAKLTRAGLDQNKVQRDINLALDLSKLKNISLSEATDLVVKAEQGRFKGLIDLGINIKGLNAENADAAATQRDVTKETNALQVAQARLSQEQRALAEFETALHEKKKVTQLDLMHEQDAKKRVADATSDVTAASQALTVAQGDEKAKIDVVNAAMDDFAGKTKNGRQTTSELDQSTTKLSNDWQDMATKAGPSLAGAMDAVVDRADKIYSAMDRFGSGKDSFGNAFFKAMNDSLINMLTPLAEVLGALREAGSWIDKVSSNNGGFGNSPEVPGGRNLRGRAAGGAVWPGEHFWVGEKGRPELFVPTQPGQVIPAESVGGARTYNLTINGAADASSADAIRRMLQRMEFLGGAS